MLKQATVENISANRITRVHGWIAVVTQFYPRYLKKKLINEYIRELAPTRALLGEFKGVERGLEEVEGASASAANAHDQAFEDIDYESKFTLSPGGVDALKRLAEMSRERDVYLICHCRVGQRCHREILLIVAEELFGAKISKLSFDWKRVRERIKSGDLFTKE